MTVQHGILFHLPKPGSQFAELDGLDRGEVAVVIEPPDDAILDFERNDDVVQPGGFRLRAAHKFAALVSAPPLRARRSPRRYLTKRGPSFVADGQCPRHRRAANACLVSPRIA